MYMAQKAKKKSKLRHAEYYDMQKTFDSLYADSKSGEVFGHLMDIISAPNNIKLAFRNIKGNDGSHTAGTDGRTIESLAVMPEDNFVKLIQKQFRRYEPKAVRRVEIPKPNGKMRPLGIPCIIDRIVQQCILQVMEPICEAKFYEHSYGFRPCRSAENAISYAYGLAQRNKLHYVVDVDVKGFFDNVDHRKLLKQIWTLGIRDTKLIQIIKAMLKAPIEMPDGEIVLPSKGTPQGGILSPLLANIVLNELDWWIASQWDEMVGHMKHPCKVTHYPNGAEKKCNSYTALKKSNLKEMRIVRYVKLRNKGLNSVISNSGLSEDDMERYRILLQTRGNRPDIFGNDIYATPGGEYTDYDIPGEALTDTRFANMIREAEKYLGYPYVWGGSSPSTSFDCSGFVSYVINHCGNGWSVGRLTANGLMGVCDIIPKSSAKPGDLIFFQGTYDTSGASHVGIYVGNGMMIHCGNPISYASIESNYWQQHFYCFGRIRN